MRTLKKLAFLFSSLASLAVAQNNPQSVCKYIFTLSTATTSTAFDNRHGWCNTYTVTFNTTGFTAINVKFEGAPDSNGTPGTWSTLTARAGNNPNFQLGVASATFNMSTTANLTHNSWLRFNVTSLTGTGSMAGTALANFIPPVVPTLSSTPIYIMTTGQSNGVGFNDGSGGDSAINTNVQVYDCYNNVWQVMRPGQLPMGADLSLTTPGINPCQFQTPWAANTNPMANSPTWHFAKTVQARCNCPVRVILLAWGGNSIGSFVGSGVASPDYAFIRSVMNTLGNPTINFFIWDQGEQDFAGGSANYLAQFQLLLAQLRAETWFAWNTPVTSTGLDVVGTNGYASVEFALRASATSNYLNAGGDAFTYFADVPASCGTIPGGVHWSGSCTVLIGQQYYTDAFDNKRFQGQVQSMTTTYRSLIQNFAAATWPPEAIVLDVNLGSLWQWMGGVRWYPVSGKSLGTTFSVTVASLPTCTSTPSASQAGDGSRWQVSDATLTLTVGIGTVVVGGSTNHVPVTCDAGSSVWRIG